MTDETPTDADDRPIAGLRDYPAPEPADGWFDAAMADAVAAVTARRRRRTGGIAAALAASLALWVVVAQWPATNDATPAVVDAGALPGVSIALAEPETLRLVFASATPLDAATLTVDLPDGVELDGFPGRRSVSWETRLVEGRNLLPLRLVAVGSGGGELTARLQHGERSRTFRLLVSVDDAHTGRVPAEILNTMPGRMPGAA